MTLPIVFVYNPTSWDASAGRPVPGGMADALVQPILPFLDPGSYTLARWPEPDAVNVYYTHRSVQGVKLDPPGSVNVFVSHGIADKDWRTGGRVRSAWDFVFVSGPAWSAKYAGRRFELDMIVEAGYTKLDPLFIDPTRHAPVDDRIRVLWAPTHGGGGERHSRGPEPSPNRRKRTSHWRGAELLGLLDPERFDVTTALHPRHRPDRRATLEEYRSVDVVVADGGSTIYESWALGLPVVFPTWLTGIANESRSRSNWTFEAELYRERIDYHADRPERFADRIVEAYENGITVEAARFIEGILPKAYRGRSGAMHARALQMIANGQQPTPFAPGPVGPVRYRNRRGVLMAAEWGSDLQRKLEASGKWARVVDDVEEEVVTNGSA